MPKAKITEHKHTSKSFCLVLSICLSSSAFVSMAANPSNSPPAVVAPDADMQKLIESARVRKAKEWQEQSQKAMNPSVPLPTAIPFALAPQTDAAKLRKTSDIEQPRVWSIMASSQGEVVAEVLYQEKIYTVQANRPVRMGPWHMVSLNSQQLVMQRALTAAEKKKWPRQLKAAERKSMEDTGVQVELFAPDRGIGMESYFPGENESAEQAHSNNFVLPASALRAANLPVAAAMPTAAPAMPSSGTGNSPTSPMSPKLSGQSTQPVSTGKR